MINNLDVKRYLLSELNALQEAPNKIVKTLPAKLLLYQQFYNEFKETCIKIDRITLQYQESVNFLVGENPIPIKITREITKNFKKIRTVASQLDELIHWALSFQYDLQRLSKDLISIPNKAIKSLDLVFTITKANLFLQN